MTTREIKIIEMQKNSRRRRVARFANSASLPALLPLARRAFRL